MSSAASEAPGDPGASRASGGVYRLERRVRFSEIDRAGIAYFANAFQYCHEAFEDMLAEALGQDLEAFFTSSPWMMPLVHAESDYQAPILIGQDLLVELRVARVGSTSLSFAYRIVGLTDGIPRAEVRLVHACIERDGFRKRSLPEDLLAGLIRLGLVPSDEG